MQSHFRAQSIIRKRHNLIWYYKSWKSVIICEQSLFCSKVRGFAARLCSLVGVLPSKRTLELIHNNSFFFLFTDISPRIHTLSSQNRSITTLYCDNRLFLCRLFAFSFYFLSIRVSDHSSTGAKLPWADVAFVFLVDRPPFISSRSELKLIRCHQNEAVWLSHSITIDL